MDNTPNQPSKFRTKNHVEVNGDLHGTYNTSSKTEFKTQMLKSILCDYSDAYIVVKVTISVAYMTAAGADANNNDKKVVFKNFALLLTA